MSNILKIFNLSILGYLILVCLLGIFYKHISFGWGLGDFFGYAFLIGGTILHGVLISTLVFKKERIFFNAILGITFLLFAIGISLQATLWRGNEYPWNGSLFYLPCPSKISVDNKKELLITMCSMEYYSKFSGNWNGKELEQIQGDLKIPKELNEYIKFPITKIQLQSIIHHKYKENESKNAPYFSLDTLKINKEYFFRVK